MEKRLQKKAGKRERQEKAEVLDMEEQRGEPLFIHNNDQNIKDLSDVLRIARAIGKNVLKVSKVNVKPLVYPFQNGYWVVVSPEHDGYGRSKPLSVEGRKRPKHENKTQP